MILRENNYDQFTVIVCGTEFSGSSLVAGALRILDVYMGDVFYPADTHQDIDFSKFEFDKSLLTAINQRNKEYNVWGFKWLALSEWLDQVLSSLRNPIFIYCHRDIPSTLNRKTKPYLHEPVVEFANHVKESSYLSDFLAGNYVPLMVVDHASKQNIFTELAEFTRCELSKEKRKQLLKFGLGGYKAL